MILPQKYDHHGRPGQGFPINPVFSGNEKKEAL